MKQFILTTEPDNDGLIRLEGKDFHYLSRVRRLAVGTVFPALLPSGEEVSVEVIKAGKDNLTCKLTSIHFDDLHRGEAEHINPDRCRLILFQVLPKADKMDLIVRQATESGIAEIVPFTSEFSVAKTNAETQKFSRWERIIKEAGQQSGSKIITKLQKPMTTEKLLDYWQKIKGKNVLGLLFHHIEVPGVLEHNSFHRYLEVSPEIVVFIIGPEGGFSETEVCLFLENGFKPMTIGNTILRVETAALYCAAAIRTILMERDAWELKRI